MSEKKNMRKSSGGDEELPLSQAKYEQLVSRDHLPLRRSKFQSNQF